MCDVFSFGVVLLELLTGKRSVDKNRSKREQDLVEWARPMLKDCHRLNQLIDTRLEGQYSTEGAKKLAALAYLCLSHNPKTRPTMRAVVKALEPLLNLTDIPIGPFTFTVYPNGEKCNAFQIQNTDKKIEEKKFHENTIEEKKVHENIRFQFQKGRKHHRRRRVKQMKSRAVHSDTTLYKTLGTSLYHMKN